MGRLVGRLRKGVRLRDCCAPNRMLLSHTSLLGGRLASSARLRIATVITCYLRAAAPATKQAQDCQGDARQHDCQTCRLGDASDSYRRCDAEAVHDVIRGPGRRQTEVDDVRQRVRRGHRNDTNARTRERATHGDPRGEDRIGRSGDGVERTRHRVTSARGLIGKVPRRGTSQGTRGSGRGGEVGLSFCDFQYSVGSATNGRVDLTRQHQIPLGADCQGSCWTRQAR